MNVTVRHKNGSRALVSRERCDLLAQLARFVIDRFFSNDPHLELKIQLDATFHAKRNTLGQCFMSTEDDKSCTLVIAADADLTFLSMLLTLAHEMVHIKQYLLGELIEEENAAYFQGKRYNVAQIEYNDYPWEIEAEGRSYGLVKRWVEVWEHDAEPWASAASRTKSGDQLFLKRLAR